MLEWISKIGNILTGLHPLVILAVIFFFGMYVFWRGCAQSRKNRSSVFDMYIISGFLSALIGRIVYILVEWDSFSSYIWYWIPYEKYGDKIFLFRLLPWRFMAIWDGGLVILSMFVSLLFFMTFYSVVVKKWRWKHMFFPVYFSATAMLGSSFIITGLLGGVNEWVYKGVVLVVLLGLFFVTFKFIYRIVSDPVKEKYILGYIGLGIVWVSSIYIAYIHLVDKLSLLENLTVAGFLLWSLLFGIFFVLDLRKARVSIQTRSSIRSVQI